MFSDDDLGQGRARTLLLLRVARRYYLDGASQDEISREVGFSRPTVSRLLREARDRGVVRIEVHHPLERVIRVERALTERFGLQDARVAATPAGASDIAPVAACAADYVAEITGPSSVIAVSNGSTIAAMVAAFPRLHRPDTCVVQMIGTLGRDNTLVDSPDICRRLADQFGGTYRVMPAPLVVGSPRLATALRREESVATALALGGRADVAVLGVGASDERGSGPIFDGWMTPAIARELARSGVAGHICGHHFDRHGRHIVTDLCRRVLAVPLDRLPHIPKVVAIAAGPDKVTAIKAALIGRHANVLITDIDTAQAVLKDG